MANILGEGFPEEIINQVKQRQKIYGAGYSNGVSRTPEEILYLNANSSWCKLVSSANITDPSILNNKGIAGLGNLLSGNTLAKEFILFNGTSYQTDKVLSDGKTYSVSEMRGGIDFTNSLTGGRKAYGMGGNEFGINPMPGIISTTIKHKNRGSIRSATVNIKAWNKTQFEIIDVLYLRLGFSVLLEWGNTMYFNNKGELEKNISNSLAKSFLDGKVSYLDFLRFIQTRRKDSQGNYDAMFAKVTNFHWSFQPDGSYDITLDLISAGDVIESFKINRTDSAVATSPLINVEDTDVGLSDPNAENSSIDVVLDKYSTTSNIANFLYKIGLVFRGIFYFQPGYIGLYNISAGNISSYNQSTYSSAISSLNITKDAVFAIANPVEQKVITGERFQLLTTKDAKPGDTHYFIRLGWLLKYIEEGVMYQIKQNNKNAPLLKFDYDVETNLMHAPPQLMSYDPFTCMVNREVEFPGIGAPVIPRRRYFEVGDPFQSDKNEQWGKIMNIYVNFKYIISKLNELRNVEDNSIALIDFLKNILDGINGAFGGFSKLDVFIDEETNSVKIIDKNPLPNSKEALKFADYSLDYALFELYGYSKRKGIDYNTAGFIKDFKFTTELTPQLSTMITVSATSQGNVVGENNTALSKLNLGLQDRFKEEINDISATPVISPKERYENAFKNYTQFVNSQLKPYLDNLFNDVYIQSEVDANKQASKTYFDLFKEYDYALTLYVAGERGVALLGKNLTSSFQPGTGFIPFNLSLTMDGLSGMKIGSKFLIDTSYLPSNYPQTVDFLIKNIQHEIKDNKWTTTLESYCIAQGSEVATVPSREATSPTVSPSSVGSDFNVTPTYEGTRKTIIDKYGWPIILSSTSPIYQSKVINLNNGRNVYEQDSNYVRNNLVSFSYKNIKISNIHKDVVTPLTEALTKVEEAGLLDYAKNIQGNIYTRDTTNAPGKLSGHAFGLSIDVNADRFPYGNKGYETYVKAIKNPSDPNHKYAKVIEIIDNSGKFNWGGRFSSTKDPHHFTVKPYNI